MKFKVDELTDELIKMCESHVNEAQRYMRMDLETLNWKETKDIWSILECLEHLNLYGDFYIPEISEKIENSPYPRMNNEFKSGLLGNYFASSMIPKKNMRKVKTFADKNPNGSRLDKSNIERFIEQQHSMIDLINRSKKVNLTKTKTAISISKLVKLRLGDSFRFIKNHDQRHIVQAHQAMEKYLKYEAMLKS